MFLLVQNTSLQKHLNVFGIEASHKCNELQSSYFHTFDRLYALFNTCLIQNSPCKKCWRDVLGWIIESMRKNKGCSPRDGILMRQVLIIKLHSWLWKKEQWVKCVWTHFIFICVKYYSIYMKNYILTSSLLSSVNVV